MDSFDENGSSNGGNSATAKGNQKSSNSDNKQNDGSDGGYHSSTSREGNQRRTDASSRSSNRSSAAVSTTLRTASTDPAKATKAMDDLLAEEMATMTLRDRQKVDDEIHGWRSKGVSEQDETDDFLADSLVAFQNEINRRLTINPNDPSLETYREAVRINATYALDKKSMLRLKFLRKEVFDVPRAVRSFLMHLDALKACYGTFALQRYVEPYFLD